MDPKFLSWYSNEIGRVWFERRGKQTTNLASISRSALQSLPVPIPPEEEQAAIVQTIEETLSRIDASREATQRELVRARSLERIILQRAFMGELVPVSGAR